MPNTGQKAFNYGAAIAIVGIVLKEVFQYGVLTEKVDELQRAVSGIEIQIKTLQMAR